MRFLNKYEVQERITTGPISVFVAQETGSGLRRLVHILQCNEVAGDLSAQQVLQMLCRIGPEPPGVVLDAGRYENTGYAYLITTLPADPLAVQRWVQSCKSHGEKAPAGGHPPLPPGEPERPVVPASDAPTAAFVIPFMAPSVLPQTSVGSTEFTKVIGQHEKSATPVDPLVPQTKYDTPGRLQSSNPLPKPGSEENGIRTGLGTSWQMGSFTREFRALLDDRKLDSPAISTGPESHEQGGFTGEFRFLNEGPSGSNSGVHVTAVPQPSKDIFEDLNLGSPSPGGTSSFAKPPAQPDGKTGEFTKFFRATGPSPNENESSLPGSSVDSTGQSLGVHISEFDQNHRQEAAPEEFYTTTPNQGGKGSITSILQTERPAEPPPVGQAQRSSATSFTDQFMSPEGGENQFFTASGRSPLSAREAASDPRSLESIPATNWNATPEKPAATRVFTTPELEGPSAPQADATPSEYTRIISRPQPPPEPVVPDSAKARSDGAAPGLATPPISQFPLPQTPHIPPVPHMPVAPSAPAIAPAAFPLPPSAAPQATPPKPVSYLPLIIMLNVVLVLSIALILYFALKAK
jgi:hypothetical protein